MNGKGVIIAILGVGVSLGGLIVNGQRSTSRDIAEIRSELAAVRRDIADLRERMARLEGRVETLVDVFTNQED